MVEYKETTDSKGNTYKKWRIPSDGNAVVCANGTNKHFRGQPNVSIRTGESSYGKEVVFQVQARDLISEYASSSGFDKHIEIYMTPEQALELLAPLLGELGFKSAGFNPKEWSKTTCEVCGEGHLYCEKCKKYTWHKGESNEVQKEKPNG